jgi:nickel transport protein
MVEVSRLLGLLLLLAAAPAHAHMLKVFATATGARIDGSVYFVGGGAARAAAIRVQTPDGEVLATLQADPDGRFSLDALRRVDHVIVADSGDGHAARFTIPAYSLPATLPTAVLGTPSAIVAPATLAPTGPPHSLPAEGAADAPAAAEPLEALVARAVAAQVRPLREQLNAYEDRLRLRDVLGGLGYILGLAGLVLWLQAKRRGRSG